MKKSGGSNSSKDDEIALLCSLTPFQILPFAARRAMTVPLPELLGSDSLT